MLKWSIYSLHSKLLIPRFIGGRMASCRWFKVFRDKHVVIFHLLIHPFIHSFMSGSLIWQCNINLHSALWLVCLVILRLGIRVLRVVKSCQFLRSELWGSIYYPWLQHLKSPHPGDDFGVIIKSWSCIVDDNTQRVYNPQLWR